MKPIIDFQATATAIRRAAIALHIYVLDQRYKALGNHLTDVEASQKAAELERINILMCRHKARTELNKLGGF